jgi:hypothetical protein
MNARITKTFLFRLALVCVALAALVMFVFPLSASAAGANVLTNADMESGTTNWVVNGAGTLSSDTTQFHGGTHSVKTTGRTAEWNGIGQNVAVSNFTSGQNWTVSVWVRSETGTPTAKATLRLTASTTTYVSLATAAINSTGWTLVTGTVPVSWSGTLTGVLFYVETAAGTDNLYIDDASLSNATVGPTATATPTATPGGSFPVPGTYYQLVSRNSGKVAEVASNSTADGGNVQQWTWNGGNNQQWSFVALAGGYYEIINRNSGKVLEVAGNSTTDGGNVQQWTWAGTNSQQWSLVNLGTGYYELVNRNSGKVLDVVGNGTADGVNIDQWTWNSGNNQQWQITAAGAVTPSPTPTQISSSGATTAWQNGQFNVDVANVVRQSNIVMASANTGVMDMMPLGNGRLGAAVWAANGFTAQLNRAADTFPWRKSQGWLVISGLTGLGGGKLDLYDAMLTRSGSGLTAVAYVLQNKDELVVDVSGANVNTTYTAQIQLWSGRSPVTSTSGAFATLSETWVDNGAGGSNQTFGTLAGLTAGGQNVTASVINGTTIQVSFKPNADGTFRVIVASPVWTGGNAMTTTTSLIGSDATAAASTLRQTHLNWWHNFWATTGLIKISGTNGPYVQNIRDIEMYSMGISNSSTFPGNHSGVLDIVSPNRDGVTWQAPDYWWWNLRMHMGALLGAGHPELTTPFFNLYKNNMSNIQTWTRNNIGGDGTNICIPETMRYNGNGYYGGDIGNASCRSASAPNWNALDQSSGSEIGLWVWQRYLQTRDQSFLSAHYPIMANSARYYLAKAPVGGDGKRHTFPSNAHETQWGVHDPITDISAMKALFPAVIQAAQILNTDASLVSQLQTAIPQIPDYPRTDWQSKTQVLNAGNDASGNTMLYLSIDPTAAGHNVENLGLETLYPYNLIGLNSSSSLMALENRTYDHRSFVNSNTWSYDALDAARLGRASDFQSNVYALLQKFQTWSSGYGQFSSGDMTPYVETDGIVAASVQEALVQDFDDILRIAPAWPSSWDVDGTVFIRDNSKVHVQIKGGQVITVVLVSGKTGNKTVVNPWGTQSVNVVNAGSGAVVVSATTASQFTIPVTSGQAYIIQLVAQPLSSYTYGQVTANPATAKKTLGPVKLGN